MTATPARVRPMPDSALVTYTRISPNRTSPRNHAIDRITIHCYVGQVTAQRGCSGKRFVTYDPKNGASCNYVVGYDGGIGLCVPEADRSWCSSSRANDHRAVTIETASDNFHPYAVTEAAYSALLDLCEDICRRNGKRRLLWLETPGRALAYEPAEDEMVLTVHRWFAAKACPGDWLFARHGEIAAEVTRRLEGGDELSEEQIRQIVRDEISKIEAERAALPASMPELVADAVALGISADGSRPQAALTREEGMVMARAAVRAARKG